MFLANPEKFGRHLLTCVRNRTLDVRRQQFRQKRGCGYDLPLAELTEAEQHNLETYKKRIKKNDAALKARAKAKAALATLNYMETFTDAKRNWDYDD